MRKFAVRFVLCSQGFRQDYEAMRMPVLEFSLLVQLPWVKTHTHVPTRPYSERRELCSN